MSVNTLELKSLSAYVENKKVLDEISLKISQGEIHVLLGPNGAGKSTISHVIMGNPAFSVKSGDILFNNESLLDLDVHERAKKGIFLGFQHPLSISGVTMVNFLRTSYNSLKGTNMKPHEFHKLLNSKMDLLGMDSSFRTRFVNEGFSGGEKKRSEILQLLLFEPKFAILDEIDSGLDVDGIKLVSESLKKVHKEINMGMLIITHHSKILDFLSPNKVHVLKNGTIIESGDETLIAKIEKEGFSS